MGDHCLDEAKVFYETFYKKHPKIKNTFPFDEPLLNLAHFLFAAIEMKNADTFMILYQNYSVSFKNLKNKCKLNCFVESVTNTRSELRTIYAQNRNNLFQHSRKETTKTTRRINGHDTKYDVRVGWRGNG